jgi:hypothetical protein
VVVDVKQTELGADVRLHVRLTSWNGGYDVSEKHGAGNLAINWSADTLWMRIIGVLHREHSQVAEGAEAVAVERIRGAIFNSLRQSSSDWERR